MVITSKYNGICRRCSCRFSAGATVEWSRDKGATHTTPALCEAAKAAAVATPAPPVLMVDGTAIVAFLQAARERGLRWPKARFLGPAGRVGPVMGRRELRISLAGVTSKNPGAIYVKLDDEYMGLVSAAGEVRGSLVRDTELVTLLRRIAAEPAKLAKEYGALTCSCSFCNLPLTDAGSVEVGYGPICAKHYGLPHSAKGAPVLTDIAAAS